MDAWDISPVTNLRSHKYWWGIWWTTMSFKKLKASKYYTIILDTRVKSLSTAKLLSSLLATRITLNLLAFFLWPVAAAWSLQRVMTLSQTARCWVQWIDLFYQFAGLDPGRGWNPGCQLQFKKKSENPSSVGMIIKHLNLQQIRLFPDTFNHRKV